MFITGRYMYMLVFPLHVNVLYFIFITFHHTRNSWSSTMYLKYNAPIENKLVLFWIWITEGKPRQSTSGFKCLFIKCYAPSDWLVWKNCCKDNEFAREKKIFRTPIPFEYYCMLIWKFCFAPITKPNDRKLNWLTIH